jgi:hypothetical protein
MLLGRDDVDVISLRIMTGSLGLGLLLAIGGSIALGLFGEQAPPTLGALGGACAGTLAGLMTGSTRPHKSNGDSPPVASTPPKPPAPSPPAKS